MHLHIVSVYDRAAGAFGRPLFVASVGLATRSFSDEVNRESPDNQMFHHPSDFELFYMGVFDDNDGKFTTPSPVSIALAANLKIKP